MSVRKLSDDKLAELRLTVRLRKESGFQAALPVILMQRRLAEFFGPLPTFIAFYPAVLLVASIGGGGPGILATVLSALAADYWFLDPVGTFRVDSPNDVLALGIFTGAGLFVSVLAERMRRARSAEASSTSFVELLGEEAGPSLDDPGRLYVRNISEAARRMGHLSVTYQCIEAAAGVDYNTILGPMA